MTGRLTGFAIFGVLAASLLAGSMTGTVRASVLSDDGASAAADQLGARQLDEQVLAEILAGQFLPQDLSPSGLSLSDLGIFDSLIGPAQFPIARIDDFQFTTSDLSTNTLALTGAFPSSSVPSSFDETWASAPAVAGRSVRRTGSIRFLVSTFSHQIGMAIWGVVGAICIAAGCSGPIAPRWSALSTFQIYRAMGLALPDQLFGRPQRELAPVKLPVGQISTSVESPVK